MKHDSLASGDVEDNGAKNAHQQMQQSSPGQSHVMSPAVYFQFPRRCPSVILAVQ
jgi:hypothetical protein